MNLISEENSGLANETQTDEDLSPEDCLEFERPPSFWCPPQRPPRNHRHLQSEVAFNF